MSSAVGKRRHPRPLEPGKQTEVRIADYQELLAARLELEMAKLRLRRVTARLTLQLADAEFGTVDGRPVLWREQTRTGGHYVRVNHREDIRSVGGPAAQRLLDGIVP